MNLLQTHIEDISDDFQSTFALVDSTTLTNMMGSHEHEKVTEIIKKYCGDVAVNYTKTNTFDDDYDIYVVKVVGLK